MKKDFEHCSVRHYKSVECGDVYYIKRAYKEDGGGFKKGGDRNIHVWVSNSLTLEDFEALMSHVDEEYIYDLKIIEQTQPIMTGVYYGSDFYFKPEMMKGTPTDETSAIDFAECLMCFNEIRLEEYGRPHWDNETPILLRGNEHN